MEPKDEGAASGSSAQARQSPVGKATVTMIPTARELEISALFRFLPENERDAEFQRRVRRSRSSDCLIWTGTRNRDGYGVFYDSYQMHLAHRWGYERFHEPIAPGMELDHTCINRRCVNLEHLAVVSRQINLSRMHLRRRQAHLERAVQRTEALGLRSSPARATSVTTRKATTSAMIRIQDGAPTDRYEAYRSALQREGQRLVMYMAIYRRIHERRHDRLAALNIAPTFFQAVLASLHVTIIVRAHALFNGGGGTEESLRTFLNFVGRNITLFSLEQLAARKGWARDSENMRNRKAPTYESVREDRKTIDRIASLKHVQTLRNKLHAHVDGEYFFDPGKAVVDAPLRWSDLTELRTTLVNIVNRYRRTTPIP
jgi:hypothetical protein